MKPNNNTNKGVDYWTNRISELEMPALCSTVKSLEKLAKDDVSSLALLGRSVMHDNALTSRILRVANSAIYHKGSSQISTVSRAAIVLGFDAVRNICITAKLLSSLLESKNLAPNVYQRLIKLMAKAFQAAMIARMMLSHHDEEMQEEAFIASLLYHIGESAFWSIGGEFTEELDLTLCQCETPAEERSATREALGASFLQLTQSIARNWGLGELLIQALNYPEDQRPDIRAIFLADKLCDILSQPVLDKLELAKRMTQAASFTGLEEKEFLVRMQRCANATHKLAEVYGAKVLLDYLPDPKRIVAAEPDLPPIPLDMPVYQVNLNIQLAKLRELTGFAINKADFNQIMQTVLEGILEGVGVDRCGVLLLSPSRKQLQPRVILGRDADAIKQEFIIDLSDKRGLFHQAMEHKAPLWVDDPSSKKWQEQCKELQARHVSRQGFLLAPLLIDSKVIGFYYADRGPSQRAFEEVDFQSFIHFSQLANVCFTVSLR
ncbi:HDOD domain-containing protein [Shewanella baltica]|uniref:HDOD domain-containing protein n=1 Tax=Shewanella baltica TaxID=62322 RepID=UPI003218A9EC